MKNGDYCPYCNRTSPGPMSDEHVIPKCIGGDRRTVIRVCQSCNSKAGSDIDSKISRYTGLRVHGLFSGEMLTHHERHESRGMLKDGRALEGYFLSIPTGDGQFSPAFKPSKEQPDGSIWLSEYDCPDVSKLPPGYQLYRADMLHSSSYQIEPPAEAGLEPAMIKILLGIIYKDQGQEIIGLSGFDIMRRCLSGVIPSQVTFKWLNSIDELRKRSPFAGSDHEFGHYEHTIWGACPDGQNFKGGASLFGTTTVDVTIDSFGQTLFGTLCTVPNKLPR